MPEDPQIRRGIRPEWIGLSIGLLAGILTWTTGSPIPLWYLEYLDQPSKVRSMTAAHLVLENGQEITLPFIKELPSDNPLFAAAISDGIELATDGSVYGLIWLDRNCGNDLVVWRRIRVDLSGLAGALNSAGIDDSRVNADVISFLAENYRIDWSPQNRSHRNHRLTVWDRIKIRRTKEAFVQTTETTKTEL